MSASTRRGASRVVGLLGLAAAVVTGVALILGDGAEDSPAVESPRAAPSMADWPAERPGSSVDVRAERPDPQPLVSAATPANSSSAEDVDITAATRPGKDPVGRPPEDLSFLVVDADATPVKGATVALWNGDHDRQREPDAVAVTDERGRAWLTKTRAVVSVRAHKQDTGTSGVWKSRYAPVGMSDELIARLDALRPGPVQVDQPGEHVLQLNPTGHIFGQVLMGDGSPAREAQVRFTDRDGGPPDPTDVPADDTSTDADGRFELEVDTPFYGHLRATVDGRSTAPQIVGVEPGETVEETLRFPAYRISGRLIGPEGWSITSAEVAAADLTKPETNGIVFDDASFHIDLAEPATYTVTAKVPGFVQDAPALATVDALEREAFVEIALIDAVSLDGTVRTSMGDPVHRHFVCATSTGLSGVDDFAALLTYGSSGNFTDEEGGFRLSGLHPGIGYSVMVKPPMGPNLAVVRDVHAVGQSLDIVIDADLVGSYRLTGTVFDADTRHPVSRFGLSTARVMPGGYLDGLRGLTWYEDARGEFAVDRIDAGTYVMVVKAEGYAQLVHGPVMIRGDDIHVELALGRASRLSARVVDADGEAVEGATIRLVSLAPQALHEFGFMGPPASDADGLMSWSGLSPGVYSAQARLGESSSGVVPVRIGSGSASELTLTLHDQLESGAIQVSLLDESGLTRSGTVVRVIEAGLPPGTAESREFLMSRTDAAGAVRYTDLRPGYYNITVGDSGSHAFRWALPVGAGETVDVTLRLQ